MVWVSTQARAHIELARGVGADVWYRLAWCGQLDSLFKVALPFRRLEAPEHPHRCGAPP